MERKVSEGDVVAIQSRSCVGETDMAHNGGAGTAYALCTVRSAAQKTHQDPARQQTSLGDVTRITSCCEQAQVFQSRHRVSLVAEVRRIPDSQGHHRDSRVSQSRWQDLSSALASDLTIPFREPSFHAHHRSGHTARSLHHHYL